MPWSDSIFSFIIGRGRGDLELLFDAARLLDARMGPGRHKALSSDYVTELEQ